MTARKRKASRPEPAAPALEKPAVPQWRRTLELAALIVILSVAVGRTFIGEMSFRVSPLEPPAGLETPGEGDGLSMDRSELSRAAMPMVILVAAIAWLAANAGRRDFRLRWTWLMALLVWMSFWMLLCAMGAADKRTALMGWAEHTSFFVAFIMVMHLCRDRKRFALVVSVLVGLGLAMAAKGLWQRFIEAPQRLAEFEQYVGQYLSADQTASPNIRLLKSRLGDASPFGFFALANIFGSLLLLLVPAAAGAAIDRLISIRRKLQIDRPGDIDPRWLAAGAVALTAVLLAVVLLLTGSRGAILAGAISSLCGLLVVRFHGTCRAHRRALLTAGFMMFLMSAFAVVGYGLAEERLPTKTMTFRWHYWTGAVKILADRPFFGTGAGNFGQHYLEHRLPVAEEAVKTPHNVLVHVFAQFGLLGGAVFSGILFLLVAAVCSPEQKDETSEPSGEGFGLKTLIALCGALLAAVLWFRIHYAASGRSPVLFFYEALLPLLALIGGVVPAWWWGRRLLIDGSRRIRATRILLVAGVIGFLLHNMVTFSFWMAGPAMVFWVVAGLCMARAGGKGRASRVGFRVVSVFAVVVFVLIGWLNYLPTRSRMSHLSAAYRSYQQGDLDGAVESAVGAAEADKADPLAAQAAAQLLLLQARQQQEGLLSTPVALARAARFADLAIQRNPASPSLYRTAARTRWYTFRPDFLFYEFQPPPEPPQRQALLTRLQQQVGQSPAARPRVFLAKLHAANENYGRAVDLFREAIQRDPTSLKIPWDLARIAWLNNDFRTAEWAWSVAGENASIGEGAAETVRLLEQAVDRDPRNARLRLDLARRQLQSGLTSEAREQTGIALMIDTGLPAESVQKLTPAEREEVNMLQRAIGRFENPAR
ncbi:MAG: O-antigen ligase family protein [Phycisphaerae bacterium]